MVSKEQKKQQLAELTELLRNAKGIYFADYSGMKVTEVDNMRIALKK
jgi:ribosomal protein L10